jgi:hypothetical protein
MRISRRSVPASMVSVTAGITGRSSWARSFFPVQSRAQHPRENSFQQRVKISCQHRGRHLRHFKIAVIQSGRRRCSAPCRRP